MKHPLIRKLTLSRFLLFAIQFIFYTGTSIAAQNLEVFDQKFKSIVFDTRSLRGGFGDVAATYLTVEDLRRLGYNGKIVIIADERTEAIFKKLATSNSSFWTQNQLILEDNIKSKILFDLYFALAKPNSEFDEDVYEDFSLTRGEILPEKPLKIFLGKNTIGINQTVFGSTETVSSSHDRSARLRLNGRDFPIQTAGLGEKEMGSVRRSRCFGPEDFESY